LCLEQAPPQRFGVVVELQSNTINRSKRPASQAVDEQPSIAFFWRGF
jgi:hypothetical protein